MSDAAPVLPLVRDLLALGDDVALTSYGPAAYRVVAPVERAAAVLATVQSRMLPDRVNRLGLTAPVPGDLRVQVTLLAPMTWAAHAAAQELLAADARVGPEGVRIENSLTWSFDRRTTLALQVMQQASAALFDQGAFGEPLPAPEPAVETLTTFLLDEAAALPSDRLQLDGTAVLPTARLRLTTGTVTSLVRIGLTHPERVAAARALERPRPLARPASVEPVNAVRGR